MSIDNKPFSGGLMSFFLRITFGEMPVFGNFDFVDQYGWVSYHCSVEIVVLRIIQYLYSRIVTVWFIIRIYMNVLGGIEFLVIDKTGHHLRGKKILMCFMLTQFFLLLLFSNRLISAQVVCLFEKMEKGHPLDLWSPSI
jgi:hypothetical protein